MDARGRSEFKYKAFISYSHRDRKWADWLHRSLEHYRIPKRLVGTVGRDGLVPARLFPLFRDRDELPSSADLSEQIHEALKESAFLIVICSTSSAKSRWVNEEILAFKRLGGESRILPLIVDGEPNADDKVDLSLDECFPPALRFRLGSDGELSSSRVEPVAADARSQSDGRENAKLKLVAGLVGVGYDALKQRELEAARRRTRVYQAVTASMALLTVLACVFAYLAYSSLVAGERQRNDALIAQSRFLARDSRAATDSGDATLGALLALKALPRNLARPERPFVQDSMRALTDAWVNLRERKVFEQEKYTDQDAHLVASAADLSPAQLEALNQQVIALRRHDENAWGRHVGAAYSPDGRTVAAASTFGTTHLLDGEGDEIARLGDFGRFPAMYSPDGQFLLTGEVGNPIIWDVRQHKQIARLLDANRLLAAAFSPDGKLVVIAYDDLRVFRTETGELVTVYRPRARYTTAIAVSPDGKLALSGGYDGVAHLWDLETGETRAALSHGNASVRAVAFSPDGTLLLTTSSNKTAQVWDAKTGQLLHTLEHDNDVVMARFSKDGSRILTASTDRTARLWESKTGKPIAVMRAHEASLRSAVFSPDGTRIVTASDDRTAILWSGDGAKLAVLRGHTASVRTAEFSPDSSTVVTASTDGTVRFWDAAVGPRTVALHGHTSTIESVDVSADGKMIATGSLDGTVRLWDRERPGERVIAADVDLRSAVFSRSGTRIVARYDNGRAVKILDTETGRELISLAHPSAATSLAISADEKSVVTGSEDGAIRVWDAGSGELRTLLQNPEQGFVRTAISRDGRMVISATEGSVATVWDINTRSPKVQLRIENEIIHRVALSADGKLAAAATYSSAGGSLRGNAYVWDTATGALVGSLRGHTDVIEAIGFSADGARLATASRDKTARVWNAVGGEPVATFQGDSCVGTAVAFSPSENRIVTASADYSSTGNLICIWDVRSASFVAGIKAKDGGPFEFVALSGEGTRVFAVGRAAAVWEVKSTSLKEALSYASWVRSVMFSPGGDLLLAGYDGGFARLWNVRTRQVVREISGVDGNRFSVPIRAAISPDGKLLATAAKDGNVRLWDAETGRQIAFLGRHRSDANSVSFSPNGKLLVSAGSDVGRIWDVEKQAEIATLEGHSGIMSAAAFSPDGTRIVTAGWNGQAKVWTVQDAKPILTLVGHAGRVNSATFSPDGEHLLTASDDGTVRLWDAANGRSIATLHGHYGGADAAVFTPDGKYIISGGGGDNAARVWKTPARCQILIDEAANSLARGATPKEREQYFLEEATDSGEAMFYDWLRAKLSFLLPAAGEECR